MQRVFRRLAGDRRRRGAGIAISKRLRRLSEAQNHRCAYCHCVLVYEQDRNESMTIDHVVPVSKGGKRKWINEVAACARCNRLKDNMSADEFMEKLAAGLLDGLVDRDRVEAEMTVASRILKRRIEKAERRRRNRLQRDAELIEHLRNRLGGASDAL